MRRSLVTLASLSTLIALGGCLRDGEEGSRAVASAIGAERHNVVVLMTDDLDCGLLRDAVEGGFMPNFERTFMQEGTELRESFVTNSLCCPSRATFLSGQYSHNHNVLNNYDPSGGVARFDDRYSIATWLHDAGYRTAHIGKYLNGYGMRHTFWWTPPPAEPVYPGHDPFNPRYVPPGWDTWDGLVDPSTYWVYGYTLNVLGANGRYLWTAGTTTSEDPNLHQIDVLASRARMFLQATESTDAQPFFLSLAPMAPHIEAGLVPGDLDTWQDIWRVTIRPPPRYENTVMLELPRPASFNEEDISDKPEAIHRPQLDADDIVALTTQYRNRIESLRGVDDMIGTLVSTLTANGEMENTVLLFTSDNGFLHGEHRYSEKVVPYEESIRVPLFIKYPGVPGGRITRSIALNNDLAPTLLAIAGAQATGRIVDGRSLLPVLQDPVRAQWRKRFLVEHTTSDGGMESQLDVQTYAALRTSETHGPSPSALYAEYAAWSGTVCDEEQGGVCAPRTFAATSEYYPRIDLEPFQMESQHSSAATYDARLNLHYWMLSLATCGGGNCAYRESL